MRAYTNFDSYYEELLGDIYAQPPDKWHKEEMEKVVTKWIVPLGISSVLDVGCGEGEIKELFEGHGISYFGVALDRDVKNAKPGNVIEKDFNFLGNMSGVHLIFSRHSLEHSPYPLLTLMEWHRVSMNWLCLVVPNPKHFTFVGRNHYSVMDATQTAWILRRAGWKIQKINITQTEFWFLCTKEPRLGYEGWAKEPLANKIYEFERDLVYFTGELDVKKRFEDRGWNGLF